MSCVRGNCSLRYLLLSYPKNDRRAGPIPSFFAHDTNYRIVLCCLHRLYSVVGVLPNSPIIMGNGGTRNCNINGFSTVHFGMVPGGGGGGSGST